MNSFFSQEELENIGFKTYGNNIFLSKKCSIYGAENISLGNNVRIDDFCILSGHITIENNVHIAAYSALYAGDVGIHISNYANISSRVCIYAISDDYSGQTMTNPMIPEKYKQIQKGYIEICKHVIVGSGCTILPGVTLSEGTAIGAMSLCKKSTEAWNIYAGIPAKKIRDRSKNLLVLEKEYEKWKKIF